MPPTITPYLPSPFLSSLLQVSTSKITHSGCGGRRSVFHDHPLLLKFKASLGSMRPCLPSSQNSLCLRPAFTAGGQRPSLLGFTTGLRSSEHPTVRVPLFPFILVLYRRMAEELLSKRSQAPPVIFPNLSAHLGPHGAGRCRSVPPKAEALQS